MEQVTDDVQYKRRNRPPEGNARTRTFGTRQTTFRPNNFTLRTPTSQGKKTNDTSLTDEQRVAQLPSPIPSPSPPLLVPNNSAPPSPLVYNSPVPSDVNDSPISSPPHTSPPLSPVLTSSNNVSPSDNTRPPSTHTVPSRPISPQKSTSHASSYSSTHSSTHRRHQIQEESEEEPVSSPIPKIKRALPITSKRAKSKEHTTSTGTGKDKEKQKEAERKRKTPTNVAGRKSTSTKKRKTSKQTNEEEDGYFSTSEDTPETTDKQAHADTTQARRRIALGKSDRVLEFVLDKILTTTEEYIDEEDCSEIQPILDVWKSEIVSGFEEYQERARENSALSRNLKRLVKERKRMRQHILEAKKELLAAQQAILQEEELYRKSEAERMRKETLHTFLANFDVLLQTPLNERTQTQAIVDNVDSMLVTIADNAHNLSRVKAINQTLQDCSNLLDVFASM